MNRYFLKSILSNPVRVTGRIVGFDSLGDNTGGLVVPETEANAALLTGLAELVKSRRGGVREVQVEEYEETKKKAAARELLILSRKPLESPYSQPVRVAVDSTKGMRLAEAPAPVPKTGVSTDNPPVTAGNLADLLKNAPAEPPKATPIAEVEAAIIDGTPTTDPFAAETPAPVVEEPVLRQPKTKK